MAAEGLFYRFNAARALQFKPRLVIGLYPDVGHQLAWPAVLDDKIGTALYGKRVQLLDIGAVINAACFQLQIKFKGLAFQVGNSYEHGKPHQRKRCTGGKLPRSVLFESITLLAQFIGNGARPLGAGLASSDSAKSGPVMTCKEPDSRDSCSPGCDAEPCIFRRDAAQSEDRQAVPGPAGRF